MSQSPFDENFLWGAATASYQVEGAHDAEGRGPSMWDTFCRTPGAVAHGHTGDRACDQFHRYAEDVALMAALGLRSYRFSIAWPRVFPADAQRRNPKGFDYYHRLVDALLEAGIQPAATLYHWDLPQYLEDAGGWPARETAERFAAYCGACFEALGDKVKTWITLNEPWCSAFLGYETGVHAPGRRDRAAAYRAVHHLLLGHGLAVRLYRAGGYGGRIGVVLNLSTPRPATRRAEDVRAADRAADKGARLFLEPLAGRPYPGRHLDAMEVRMPLRAGDLETIAAPVDFLGLNYYSEDVVCHAPGEPEEHRVVPAGRPRTAMGWDIVPDGLERQLRWVHERYKPSCVYVTENGCAFEDRLDPEGRHCHDPARVAYLREHRRACARAMTAGVPLAGYYLWSFLDNFEWAFGYTRRFGIVFCDYGDLRRVPKDSYYYYRDVIAGHESFD